MSEEHQPSGRNEPEQTTTNSRFATIIAKGREALERRDKLGITFEKLPPMIPKNLCEVLRIELYSDGAGI